MVVFRIVSLAVNPAWERKKLVASLASDKTVKLWNMEECVFQLSHKAHTVSSNVGFTEKSYKFFVYTLNTVRILIQL